MDLEVLSSSSEGNCYLLKNGQEVLMIECGVSIAEIKRALDFSFRNVVGCILTHEHKDHSKSTGEVLRMGVHLYTSAGTAAALGLNSVRSRLTKIEPGKAYTIGQFRVLPFRTEHDVKEPLGFVINHEETGNILFITDSFYVRDTFKNIHNVIIEANYSRAILEERVKAGESPELLRNRIIRSHMSLEMCRNTLLANDLSKVQNIVLIHLSDHNSNSARFKSDIEAATGKKVYVADKGLIVKNFHKQPF